MTADRERDLVEAFALFADTLVDDYDVSDLLTALLDRCVALFPVHAGGLLLGDPTGKLQLAATSSEDAELLEFLQLKDGEGACVDAYRSGTPTLVDDLEAAKDRWPSWAPQAGALGFRSVTSIPLRLREQSLGALNLFGREPGHLRTDDLYAARALTQLATTAVLQHRALRDAQTLADQLQLALDSRVVIEQAKGVLAERHQVGLEAAFEMLRTQARRQKRKISDLAREVVVAGRG